MPLRNLRRGAVYGNYVPTLTAIDGLADDPTLLNAMWHAVGDKAVIDLAVEMDVSAFADIAFRFSLPFGPVFTSAFEIIGVAAPVIGGGYGGNVTCNVANQEGEVRTGAAQDGVQNLVATCTYIVR